MFARLEFVDFVFVVGVVRISSVEKVKLWVVLLVLSNSRFEVWPVASNEIRCLIDDVCDTAKETNGFGFKRKLTAFESIGN